MAKVIFKKDYDWESSYDLPRDVHEALNILDIKGEFDGKIRILITHITDKEDDSKEKD